HFTVHLLLVGARMRPVGHAAMPAMRGPRSTLPSASRALLAIQLPRAAAHLTASFCIMGASAGVGILENYSLVHNRHVWLNAKDIVIQFKRSYCFAGLVIEFFFHHRLLCTDALSQNA